MCIFLVKTKSPYPGLKNSSSFESLWQTCLLDRYRTIRPKPARVYQHITSADRTATCSYRPWYSNWISSQTQDWGALRTLPFCIVQQGKLLRGRKHLLKPTVPHGLSASWGNGGVSNPTSGRGEASVDSLQRCRLLLSYKNINGIQL